MKSFESAAWFKTSSRWVLLPILMLLFNFTLALLPVLILHMLAVLMRVYPLVTEGMSVVWKYSESALISEKKNKEAHKAE